MFAELINRDRVLLFLSTVKKSNIIPLITTKHRILVPKMVQGLNCDFFVSLCVDEANVVNDTTCIYVRSFAMLMSGPLKHG